MPLNVKTVEHVPHREEDQSVHAKEDFLVNSVKTMVIIFYLKTCNSNQILFMCTMNFCCSHELQLNHMYNDPGGIAQDLDSIKHWKSPKVYVTLTPTVVAYTIKIATTNLHSLYAPLRNPSDERLNLAFTRRLNQVWKLTFSQCFCK